MPQSSVQMTGKRPVFVGVTMMCWEVPGTTSCLTRHSGTQKEWITSFAVSSSSSVSPSGT